MDNDRMSFYPNSNNIQIKFFCSLMILIKHGLFSRGTIRGVLGFRELLAFAGILGMQRKHGNFTLGIKSKGNPHRPHPLAGIPCHIPVLPFSPLIQVED